MKKFLLAAGLGLGIVVFTMAGNLGHATALTGISYIDTVPKDTTVPDTPDTPTTPDAPQPDAPQPDAPQPDNPQPDAPQPDTATTPSY